MSFVATFDRVCWFWKWVVAYKLLTWIFKYKLWLSKGSNLVTSDHLLLSDVGFPSVKAKI